MMRRRVVMAASLRCHYRSRRCRREGTTLQRRHPHHHLVMRIFLQGPHSHNRFVFSKRKRTALLVLVGVLMLSLFKGASSTIGKLPRRSGSMRCGMGRFGQGTWYGPNRLVRSVVVHMSIQLLQQLLLRRRRTRRSLCRHGTTDTGLGGIRRRRSATETSSRHHQTSILLVGGRSVGRRRRRRRGGPEPFAQCLGVVRLRYCLAQFAILRMYFLAFTIVLPHHPGMRTTRNFTHPRLGTGNHVSKQSFGGTTVRRVRTPSQCPSGRLLAVSAESVASSSSSSGHTFKRTCRRMIKHT